MYTAVKCCSLVESETEKCCSFAEFFFSAICCSLEEFEISLYLRKRWSLDEL